MTEAPNGDAAWSLDVNVKMKDKRAFVKASQNVTQSLDEADLYPYLAKFVKAWPYMGDPTLPESYDELTQTEFQEVVKRVSDAFQVLAGGTESSGVRG